MEDTDQKNKKFTKKTKGAHADKGKAAIKRKKGLNPEPNRGKNPKAFTRPADGTHKVKVMKRKVEVVETSISSPPDPRRVLRVRQGTTAPSRRRRPSAVR